MCFKVGFPGVQRRLCAERENAWEPAAQFCGILGRQTGRGKFVRCRRNFRNKEMCLGANTECVEHGLDGEVARQGEELFAAELVVRNFRIA